jgi:hypothetical protein
LRSDLAPSSCILSSIQAISSLFSLGFVALSFESPVPFAFLANMHFGCLDRFGGSVGSNEFKPALTVSVSVRIFRLWTLRPVQSFHSWHFCLSGVFAASTLKPDLEIVAIDEGIQIPMPGSTEREYGKPGPNDGLHFTITLIVEGRPDFDSAESRESPSTTMVLSLSQPSKQVSESVSIDEGRQIDSSDVQYANAVRPTFVTFDPDSNPKLARFAHPMKQSFGMISIREGMQID